MKKIVLLFIGLIIITGSFAQNKRDLTFNKNSNLFEVVYYHDNGQISQTGYYTAEGKLHGEWFSYCTEGNKIVAAKYNNGDKVGKWFYWSDNKLKEVDYSNNEIAKVNEWTNKTTVASNK